MGICWLVSGILPCPDCILGATDSSDHRTRVSVVAPYIQRAVRALSRRSVRLWTSTRLTVRDSLRCLYPTALPSQKKSVQDMLVGKVIRSTFRDFVATNLLSVTIYYHIPVELSTLF